MEGDVYIECDVGMALDTDGMWAFGNGDDWPDDWPTQAGRYPIEFYIDDEDYGIRLVE